MLAFALCMSICGVHLSCEGKADAAVVVVKDRVVLAHEDVAEDVDRPTRRWQVQWRDTRITLPTLLTAATWVAKWQRHELAETPLCVSGRHYFDAKPCIFFEKCRAAHLLLAVRRLGCGCESVPEKKTSQGKHISKMLGGQAGRSSMAGGQGGAAWQDGDGIESSRAEV